MRVALLQHNPTVGALEANARALLSGAERAATQGAQIVIAPELALLGYPPRDLLERPDFVHQVAHWEQWLATHLPASLWAVFGSVSASPPWQRLTNDAVVAHQGKVIHRVSKQLLPTYDVFDEARYFEPGPASEPLVLAGRRYLVTICEDAWADAGEGARRYPHNPLDVLSRRRCDGLINLSASPFTWDKWRGRMDLFSSLAKRHALPVLLCNQVGGNDQLIFDGRSSVFRADGSLAVSAPSFETATVVWDDTDRCTHEAAWEAWGEPEILFRALVLGLQDSVSKCGFNRVIVGLSGGIDSALVATLACEALGSQAVLGVAMPTRYSSAHSLQDAEALARQLAIAFEVVDIDPLFEAYLQTLAPSLNRHPLPATDTTLENLQARIRGTSLMALANRSGSLVLATSNKSELAVGYCTLYGDMVGGLSVINDLSKTRVYALAHWLHHERGVIPPRTLSKAPSAELRPDQRDEDSLPPYAVLDPILELYLERQLSVAQIVAEGYDLAVVQSIVNLVNDSEYKRHQSAPGLIVTSKALGMGRRVPVAKHRAASH